ncbi:MAG: YraN family protein [Verrucomicrobiota bacterium]
MSSPQETGRYGERVAAAFLRRHGYRVLTRNFRTERGEIDLVCRHGEVLAFVEVRARASGGWVRGGESIDARKEEALREAARHYLHLLRRDDVTWRFDAVDIQLTTGAPPVCTLLPDFMEDR